MLGSSQVECEAKISQYRIDIYQADRESAELEHHRKSLIKELGVAELLVG